DAGAASPPDRRRLRVAGRDDERALHRGVVEAVPRTGDTGSAAQYTRCVIRQSASERCRHVRDCRQPAWTGALSRRTYLVLADPGPCCGTGARARRSHRRSTRRNRRGKGDLTMGVPVYKRILDLFEAEGVNTLFGIPDPNFVHLFAEADARGWSVVAPHHELSAGFMAEAASRMTGKPGLCIGTLGPAMANSAGAVPCALVENSPVIFLGGQRARITERRVRRGRIQFVRQEALFAPSVKYSASIEYADQTDEIVHEAIRRAMSGTPGPAYIEYPSHVILE